MSCSRCSPRGTRRPPRASPSRSSCCSAIRAFSPACARSSRPARMTPTSTPWSRRRCGCAPPVPRTVGGWEPPAGVKVYPGIALVHMREDLYPRPHEFRPERFLDEGAESYSWLPFGGGIRRCIGAALALAEMAEVLRVAVPAVELRPLRDRPDPVVLRGITLAPRYGVRVAV